MPIMPLAIVPNLGQLFTVMIDPLWPYAKYWNSGIGQGVYPSNGVLSAIFFDPSDIVFSESATVTYSSPDIIGRPEPLQVWMNTGAREVSFNFEFHVQGTLSGKTNVKPDGSSTGSGGTNPTLLVGNTQIADTIDQEVIQPAKFLDALKYPIIDINNISHGPPPVILTVGQLLQMRAIVTDAKVDWKFPIDVDTYLPHAASVQVTFRSVSRQVGNYNFDSAQRFVGAPLAPAAISPFSIGGSSGNNTLPK